MEATFDGVLVMFGLLSRSAVEAMGYVVVEAECAEIPGVGATGIHAVNSALIDDVLNPLEPEAVVLAPDGAVWAVEWRSPTPGKVLGQELEFAEEIELYALRGWLVYNPEGQFADLNPPVVRAERGEIERVREVSRKVA